jgi:predicted DNA-binding transcriptional regulator AlpA
MPAPHPHPDRDEALRQRIGLVSAADLIKQLGVSRQTLCKWVRSRQFPEAIFVSIGSPARWRVADVEDWLASKQAAQRIPRPGCNTSPRVPRVRRTPAQQQTGGGDA